MNSLRIPIVYISPIATNLCSRNASMFERSAVALFVCCVCIVQHVVAFNRDQQQVMDFNSMIPYPRAGRDLFESLWPFHEYGFAPLSSLQPIRKEMSSFQPLLHADLVEKADGSFMIHCDLPGVDIKDLDITLDGNELVIKAERSQVHKQDTDIVHQIERKFGLVSRRLKLPANCDGDGGEVKFKDGVLEITFPKKAGTAAKKKLAIKQ